jgi:hypothetical protein
MRIPFAGNRNRGAAGPARVPAGSVARGAAEPESIGLAGCGRMVSREFIDPAPPERIYRAIGRRPLVGAAGRCLRAQAAGFDPGGGDAEPPRYGPPATVRGVAANPLGGLSKS